MLVVIDPTDFRIALAQAQAALGQAQRKVEGYFANGDADAATTSARAAERRPAPRPDGQRPGRPASAPQTDLGRRQALALGRGLRRRTDAGGEQCTRPRRRWPARAALAEAQANRDAAAGQERVATALIAGAEVEQNPEVAAAQAKVDQAKLDLDRTVIRAPDRRRRSPRTIVAGRPAGHRRRAADDAWCRSSAAYVDANFKEVQLRSVQLGQPVDPDQPTTMAAA